MQPTSFLSSADNLFKFLFLNGIIFILLGMFYPLEQRNQLELKILEYNKKVALINQENNILNRDIKSLNNELNLRIPKSEKLAALKKKKSTSTKEKSNIKLQLDEIKSKTNLSYQNLQAKSDELSKNLIIIKNEESLIISLKNQKETYDTYCYWFFYIGIISGTLGFIFWSISTYISERKTYKEMRNL
ncbi:hypothetical protein [Flavobacterium sp.]|uniref:hypothetical protein n=1 Tax=Flavobacterium sp. TaxID=239 RepID=UPI00260AF32B|nr:hypothetical protein [Flavobacterium sp.]